MWRRNYLTSHDAHELSCRNEGVRNVEVPFLATQNIPATPVTWNYTTVPQVGLDNRTVAYPRGRVLGGSSSISKCTRSTW